MKVSHLCYNIVYHSMNESLNCTLGRHSGHTGSRQHRVCLMAGDTVARSVNKFIYIRVGGQIRWIYPPLNKPKTLCTRRQSGLRGQVRFQFITSVLPDRLKEKINLARARWSSLVDKPCRATRLRVVDIPQVFHSPPEQVCNA